MNEALQTLEIKVENNGTTPQGKIFAREWNVLVEAVKALDLKEFDEAKLLQFLRDKGFITSEDIPDVDFSNVVTLSGQQIISGAKDFVGGLSVNGMPIVYDPIKKAWEFKGDFVVTGAITMFGSLSGFQPSTVTEAVEVDGETIVKTKNTQGQWQLTAIGGGGGTGGGISAAEVNILISNALEPYALSTSIPTDNKQLLNGAGYATVGDLDTRINNLINGAPAAYDTLKEIADVLAGNVNSIGDILTALDTKATKTYVDTELTKYVKLATAQPIEAQHNFVNGLQIGGLPITKSASSANTIYLDANLVVSGAITMFGSGSTTFPTIWANIPFNPEHLSWDGSQWNVIVEGGSGSDISSALVGYATQSWVGDNYLSKSGGLMQDGGGIRWANNINAWDNVPDGFVGVSNLSSDPSMGYYAGLSYKGYYGLQIRAYGGGDFGIFEIRNNDSDAWQTWRKLLHSGNYSDLLAGGTINGSITAIGNIYLGDDSESMLVMNRDYYNRFVAAKAGGRFAWRVNGQIDDVLILDESGYLRSPIGFVGNLTGNADSATNADKLDNLHSWDFVLVNSRISSGSNINHIGYGYVENGNITTGPMITYGANTTYFAEIQSYAYNESLYYRIHNENGYGPVKSFAFTDSNVASATQLQTPRSIWGQNFDGSGDITGPPSFPRYININRDATSGAIIDSSALGCEIETYSSHIAIKSLSNDGVNIPSHLCLIKGGNVAVGGATASEKLHVYGNILVTGTVTMFSQASMKNIINREGLDLEQLAMIQPARFTWKDGRDTLVHAGGIADEVMQVLPEVVHRTKDDKLTMDYGSAGFFMAASLIKPVIDHEQRLQSAEKEIKDLKAENKRLREQLRAS